MFESTIFNEGSGNTALFLLRLRIKLVVAQRIFRILDIVVLILLLLRSSKIDVVQITGSNYK